MNGKQIVKHGYDGLGEQYFVERIKQAESLIKQEYFVSFVSQLVDGESVLDAGCGPGVPFTRELSRRFSVTGIDLSKTQLEIAEREVADTSFHCSDMCEFDAPDESFAGICSLYAIIHVPRTDHMRLFKNFHRMLKPNGLLFVVLGKDEDEHYVSETYYGQEMYWSSYTPGEAKKVVEAAGFRIYRSEIVEDAMYPDSSHLFLLARKV